MDEKLKTGDLSNKENGDKGANKLSELKPEENEMGSNETFTSKAKKALEKYKASSRSSNSSLNSSDEGMAKLQKNPSKSKHPPMPFRNDINETKFVD